MTPSALDAAYAACEALLRDLDRDRWLAALFVPAEKRRHVHALWAYSLEVARVREHVRDPMPGEVRLQWWVDALAGAGHGDVGGHPVAAALLDTAVRFGLSQPALAAVADARRFDLYDDPVPTLGFLEGYAGETVSSLLQQASLVLCDGDDPRTADLAGHGGVAEAMVGIMRAMPLTARRGQCLLPADVLARHGVGPDDVRRAEATDGLRAVLAEMREHVRHHRDRALAAMAVADPRALAAYVGLGLVDPRLARLERSRDPFGPPVDVPAWTKPLVLWRFSRRLTARRRGG